MIKLENNLQCMLSTEQCLKVKQMILTFFQNVPDPRAKDNCKHSFADLLFMMTLAVFSGAEDIDDIHQYVVYRQHQLECVLGEFTPPSYNTFWWIISRMDPEAFAQAFYAWSKAKASDDDQICIDGKSLRGSLGKNGKCNLHIVHAYAHNLGMLIGQEKIQEKSNEITAIPTLLEQLDIRGSTVTIDAAGCQKVIVNAIEKRGGHWIIALKKNQRNFYDSVVKLFEEARKQDFEYVQNCDFYEGMEKKSGRIDKRSIAIISDPSEIELSEEWPGIETFIEVTRETSYGGKKSTERRYYISDRIDSAKEFGRKIQAHWGVESFHWVLDVVFGEDSSNANSLHGAENLGILRRAAMNWIKGSPQLKKNGFARIRKQAKWSNDDTIIKEICEALFNVKFF